MESLEIIVVSKVETKRSLLEVFEVKTAMTLSLLELVEVNKLKMSVIDMMELSWKDHLSLVHPLVYDVLSLSIVYLCSLIDDLCFDMPVLYVPFYGRYDIVPL